MRRAIVVLLLVATSARAADPTPPYLGGANEGEDRSLEMVLTDKNGTPVIPAEVQCWVYAKSHGSEPPILVYECPAIAAPGTHLIVMPLPPKAQTLAAAKERRMVVVRVKVGNRYSVFRPEYDVEDLRGFRVVNGVLVPDPTPTPKP